MWFEQVKKQTRGTRLGLANDAEARINIQALSRKKRSNSLAKREEVIWGLRVWFAHKFFWLSLRKHFSLF